MAFTDLFSTSFLFSILIIIALIGGIVAYVTYRISEQDHKLNSMIGLISTMAEESQFFRNNLNILQKKLATHDLPVTNEIHYASQLIGGDRTDGLINVSDDEGETDSVSGSVADSETNDGSVADSETNDGTDADSETNDGSDADSETNDETNDETDADSETNDGSDAESVACSNSETDANTESIVLNNNNNEYIKRVNLNLDNIDLNIKIPYEEINVDNETYQEPNLVIEQVKGSEDFGCILETTDIQPDSKNNNDLITNINKEEPFLKNISITDFGDGTISLGQIEDNNTDISDYKKMSINKLREIIVSKGTVQDASKLKKQDILKLLEQEI